MSVMAQMQEENGHLRARLGSGEPGLNILLGGTLQNDQVTTTFSGAGAMSSTYRTALVNKDVRLASIASGGSSGGRPDLGNGGDGGGPFPVDPP
jgi:hypothetical protein